MRNRTVVAIPPDYKKNQSLDLESSKNYVKYLDERNVDTVMTTAGTSHFNLLTCDEIHQLNKTVVTSFSGKKIIGVPILSLNQTKEFVKIANEYLDEDSNLMLLYPDRFYNNDVVERYLESIAEICEDRIYIHGKTLRKATGGLWDYESQVVNNLFDKGLLKGIKEEHSQLEKSYNFISDLKTEVDVIVAGGSMRRFEFLRSAGANSFLSGVGNLFPTVEQRYIDGDRKYALEIEKKMFKVFMQHGWHKSLRISLKHLNLTCYHNRQPWPPTTETERLQITKVVKEIKNER
tara:strand:- start:620 stop:1492 length:873 start_codon:yes stop_codon:yes gene_type:complete